MVLYNIQQCGKWMCGVTQDAWVSRGKKEKKQTNKQTKHPAHPADTALDSVYAHLAGLLCHDPCSQYHAGQWRSQSMFVW